MIWIDIILGLCIIAFIVAGFRQGIMVQLGGIAGLLLGVWLAFRFGARAGEFMGVEGEAAPVVGFAVLFIAALIVVAILGRLLRGLFRFAGLGIVDRVGGALLAGVKAVLIMSLLAAGFDSLNREYKWVEQSRLETSRVYTPLRNTAAYIFPFFDSLKNKLF